MLTPLDIDHVTRSNQILFPFKYKSSLATQDKVLPTLELTTDHKQQISQQHDYLSTCIHPMDTQDMKCQYYTVLSYVHFIVILSQGVKFCNMELVYVNIANMVSA